MTPKPRLAALAPFGQRSFRFQWPADLATAWAFEMETLILGWYVLTTTGSVVWLTAFAALQFIGTLVSPLLGLAGDRMGHRRILLAMRASYAVLAAMLAGLALAGALSVWLVFAIALLNGLVRPSDIGMRNALIGATMPRPLLMGAMAIERCSGDAARVAGALSGAALVTALGIGPAYVGVTLLYLVSLLLMLGVAESRPGAAGAAASRLEAVWRDLAAGFGHVRRMPPLLAAMLLAFIANALVFPLSGGLLPHVARDVYGMDQGGLGWLVASFSGGALLGSVVLSARGAGLPAGRCMMGAALIWFALMVLFTQAGSPAAGMALLFAAGAVQSFCMVPMSVLLLRVSAEGFRGRVMGLRVLAVYGMPVGLLSAGPLIAWQGFAATGLLFAGVALVLAVAIALAWRRHLWPGSAPANARAG